MFEQKIASMSHSKTGLVEKSSNDIECRYEIQRNVLEFFSSHFLRKRIERNFFDELKRNFFIDDKALPILPVDSLWLYVCAVPVSFVFFFGLIYVLVKFTLSFR